MYDFDNIYLDIMQYEGSYSNDSEDSGGETYRGISRKHNPMNPIWNIIDAHKNEHNFMPFLETSTELEKHVFKFYNDLYSQNKVNHLKDYELKRKYFNSIVNLGRIKATVILQQAFNLLKKSKVLEEDGLIGTETIRHINNLGARSTKDLLMFYRAELYVNYRTLTLNRPKDKKYLKGWTRRAFS